MDRNPWLFACKNGVIDLKTGEFLPGRPEDYIKTASPIEWNGFDAKAPRFETFLSEIFDGDVELTKYIQRLFGYVISGSVKEHILPILYGEKRNGKGTLLETLAYVLGPLAFPIEAEMLFSEGKHRSSSSPSADIMSLRGRRLIWGSEGDEGARIDVRKVKWLTGNDTLVGRPPHGKEMIKFTPTHIMFLLTNHKPQIPSNESAMWERVHLIPFKYSYVADPDPNKPNERQRDADLPEKLREEAAGILAWLVKGCLEWQRIGLNPPNTVKVATKQYREEEDIVGHFLQECTYSDPRKRVQASTLYSAYSKWCFDNGYHPLGGKKFGERIGAMFKKKVEARGNFYMGLDILTTSYLSGMGWSDTNNF